MWRTNDKVLGLLAVAKQIMACAAILVALTSVASAGYEGWRHSGSLWILTTPDGADLPASASEENFPLLVRLTRDNFDFSQAKPGGEDIRFSDAAGKPLAYQIEQWDAAKGAAIWVRIPAIKGNARQEIRMHWGKADAKSESDSKAVFNESNGYLTVLHMADPVKDEIGTVTCKDTGTTAADGLIGPARHFSVHKGINCGETLTGLPTGDSPHTSELWIRAEAVNAIALGWGNQHGQGKVVMCIASPPHIRMDCFFSGANVQGENRLPMQEWVHVAHTYKKGESRIYVNGRLDGVSTSPGSPLAIKSPARMYVGGWYGNYQFVGDIDEVRLSKATRSADWVKLEYENQNPLQTLVGGPVPTGSEFAVSTAAIQLDEGKTATVTAKAGGAQKVSWILKQNGTDAVVAVDKYSYTLAAGRVTGDASYVLQFKAVYPNEVKTKNIAVTVKEAIPEPVFTLKAPKTWNGRDAIEVVPQLANLAAMQAKGACELRYQWTISGGAVIKQIAPEKLILKRSQYSGPICVKASIDNGGKPTVQTIEIAVKEPAKDAWAQRTPEKDEKPEEGQFYARDDKNEGTLFYNGTLDEPAEAVFLKLYADDKLVKTETQKPGADKAYALSVKLKPGLIRYRVEFGTKAGAAETVLHTVDDLVCGDAYLIEGQSNALATDTGEKSPAETNEWIRSYGRPSGDPKAPKQNLWCRPVWKAQKGEKAELGWWGMELAKQLVASDKMPICIINAAVGGTRIDQHQRNEEDPTDLNTIYGRMLWRVKNAKLTHGIRAVLWHQGEADQGSDGPDGGYGSERYQQYFVTMSAAWKEDMPNIEHYYLFQIWPNGCSQGGGHGDMLREMQRTLPRLYSHMDVMPTLGIKPPGGCHYPLIGWTQFARLMQPLLERDFYGKAPTASITAPNLKRAYYTSAARDAIALEFDQPVVWSDALAGQFYLDEAKDHVASGSVSGNVVTLKLKEPSKAAKITYLHELQWSQDKLLVGANGIAALTFCGVPIEAAAK